MSLKPDADGLIDALMSPDLQAIAWEDHGFRGPVGALGLSSIPPCSCSFRPASTPSSPCPRRPSCCRLSIEWRLSQISRRKVQAFLQPAAFGTQSNQNISLPFAKNTPLLQYLILVGGGNLREDRRRMRATGEREKFRHSKVEEQTDLRQSGSWKTSLEVTANSSSRNDYSARSPPPRIWRHPMSAGEHSLPHN